MCKRILNDKQRERLFDKMERAELDIRAFYKEREEKEEAEDWKLMRENPQNFYRLAKRKSRTKG